MTTTYPENGDCLYEPITFPSALTSSYSIETRNRSDSTDPSIERKQNHSIRFPPTPPTTMAIEIENHDLLMPALTSCTNDVPESLSSRKNDPGLRLPSFKVLGIGTPNYFGDNSSEEVSDVNGRILSFSFDTTKADDRGSLKISDLCDRNLQIYKPHDYGGSILTPPTEKSETGFALHTDLTTTSPNSSATLPSQTDQSTLLAQDSTGEDVANPNVPSNVSESDLAEGNVPWAKNAVQLITSSLQAAIAPGQPAKVLSHALPSTSSQGHIYNTIVSSLQTTLSGHVELCHAIPGKFNLAELPKSPPATPGASPEEGDYFNQVFSTGVTVVDYQEKPASLPRSPCPIVSPASIHLSIVERYIPPSSTREFTHMFDLDGPSILVDRLVELHTTNGYLMFIYPTLKGARTFVEEHLSPILDPQLRAMAVLHDMPASLGAALGQMSAVSGMLDFDGLRKRIEQLCTRISELPSSSKRAYGNRARFGLVYASAEQVMIDRSVWTNEWWIKQEKARVRDVLKRYVGQVGQPRDHQRMDRSATPAELMQELFDALCNKSYDSGISPTNGVEVGVFVIKRYE